MILRIFALLSRAGIMENAFRIHHSGDIAVNVSLAFTDAYCNTDVDECRASRVCQNGGTCRNLEGSYR